MKAAVMGSGAWGTAFAMVLADAGNSATIWCRDQAMADGITHQRRNTAYHPDIQLPDDVHASARTEDALAQADLVVLAVPAQVLRENLQRWGTQIPPSALVISLIKGIELGTTQRMSEVIADVGGIDPARIAVLSGPNLATEIAERQPTATTIACTNEDAACALQEVCTTDYFRPYRTVDVVGTEVGGAVKNVIALANGIAVGMGLGENSQASLMTRGLAEMARLGVALGADPLTFQGLAGVGDLVATCQSPLSRNRSFGENLGRGLTVDQTIAVTKQTCEGYKSCQPILKLAQDHDVEMPITEQVVEVLHRGKSPRTLASAFMSRDPKRETVLAEQD